MLIELVNKELIHVGVGLIIQDDKVLIAKRPKHLHMGGFWEFPGGKVEKNEVVEDALAREMNEELGIVIQDYQPFMISFYNYTEKSVFLDVWTINKYRNEPVGNEGQEIKWCSISELSLNEFPPANHQIIERLGQVKCSK